MQAMTQARQWWVLVRYKDEPGAGFGKQYVTATNAYEAIQMAACYCWVSGNQEETVMNTI
jgi:hypothetical protein